MATKISYIILFITGLGMLFIGARFLISPEAAALAYGTHLQTGSDFSFHYIKGIRDLFSGLLVCLLVLYKERRALGMAMLAASIIPFGDMLIVLSKEYNSIQQAIPHISALVICLGTGFVLLLVKPVDKAGAAPQGFIHMVQSASTNAASIIELNILPGNKTPWHYHTLFTESFEIVEGMLEVGIGKTIHQLKKGDKVSIAPGQQHYYNNVYREQCIVRTTIEPGNIDFENALLILKGLEADGLATSAGTPKKLADLALFIRLNNSMLPGLQKVAAPFFNYIADRAIRSGRLEKLMQQYSIK